MLNSLDAKSTSIAVRINLQTFRIQVVDNGVGITKSNMNLIGIRYMTSKCQSIEDLKRIKTFGFRGESLASIRNVSKKVVITSRPDSIENTYSKTHTSSKWETVESVKQRPSQGTTVTIEGFMYNMPVRQKRINQNIDLHEVRKNLECLAIIHPNVSFNLRNDATGKIALQRNKSQTVSQALTGLYPDIVAEDLMDFRIAKGKIKVSGFIYKGKSNNRNLQFVYLNKRPIVSQKIQDLMNSLLMKSLIFQSNEKSQHPMYIMNVSCPYSEIDLALSPSKKTIEFKHWDVILKCIEKATTKLLEQENLIDPCAKLPKDDEQEVVSVRSNYGISQMKDAVKSAPVKRKIVKSGAQLDDKHINNPKRRLWNVDEALLLGKEMEISSKKDEDTTGNSIDAKDCRNKIVTSVEVYPEKDLLVHDKENNGKKIKSIMKDGNKLKSFKEAVPESVIDLIEVENNEYNKTNYVSSNRQLQSNDHDEIKVTNDKDNRKHINTQSLVLNSDINTSKPAYSWLNSNIDANVLEDQQKGKNLIMDMFLKSTLVFPNGTPETTDKDKKKSNPNATMMTMSVKFTSKRTIVTNSIRDWNASNKTNQNVQTDTNQNKKTEHEEQKVSKCIQTTMIEHQKEFKLNFNYVHPQEDNSNSKFDIYNLKSNNFNVTFSRFFKQDHNKNKYNKLKTNNYDKYFRFQNNYDNFFTNPRNYQNHFQDNRNNYNIIGGFDNVGLSTRHNFGLRKPIKRYFSDYNIDFSNFNNFHEPYKQFVKQRYNLHDENRFFPSLNKMGHGMYQQNQFFSNQDPNWPNFISNDYTIPLYQRYNPYKSNNIGEFKTFPLGFQNQQRWIPQMYNNINNNNNVRDEELYRPIIHDVNLNDNTRPYGDVNRNLKHNGFQFEKPKHDFVQGNFENHQEYHQNCCRRAESCTCKFNIWRFLS